MYSSAYRLGGKCGHYPLLLHFLLASQLHEAFLKILPYSCVIAVPQKTRLWRRNPWGGCKKTLVGLGLGGVAPIIRENRKFIIF